MSDFQCITVSLSKLTSTGSGVHPHWPCDLCVAETPVQSSQESASTQLPLGQGLYSHVSSFDVAS